MEHIFFVLKVGSYYLAMILKGGEVGPSCSHVEPLHSHSTEGQVLENDPSFVSQSVPLRQSLLTAMAHPPPHGCAPLPRSHHARHVRVLLRPLVSEASLTTEPADDKSKKDIIIRSAPLHPQYIYIRTVSS